jgi:hypothetical protein
MMRVDAYSEQISRTDLIKCDAEGAELLILRGGENHARTLPRKNFPGRSLLAQKSPQVGALVSVCTLCGR